MTQTNTPNRRARLDSVLTIFMAPQDMLGTYDLMRERWAAMTSAQDETFIRLWEGSNCKVQFKLDPFRTEGVYGKPGTVIPPPGGVLSPDDREFVEKMRQSNTGVVQPTESLTRLLAIIDKLTGKAVSVESATAAATKGDDGGKEPPVAPGKAKRKPKADAK